MRCGPAWVLCHGTRDETLSPEKESLDHHGERECDMPAKQEREPFSEMDLGMLTSYSICRYRLCNLWCTIGNNRALQPVVDLTVLEINEDRRRTAVHRNQKSLIQSDKR